MACSSAASAALQPRLNTHAGMAGRPLSQAQPSGAGCRLRSHHAAGSATTHARRSVGARCMGHEAREADSQPPPGTLRRRSVLLSTTAAGLAVVGLAGQTLPSLAEEGASPALTLTPYVDEDDAFSIGVPEGWVAAEAASGAATSNGTRRTLAWFPKDGVARDLNVSLLITNTSFEFTKLGSFGSAAAFGQNLVNSLDRSYLLREQQRTGKPSKEPIQLAKLVDYNERADKYFVEYTVQLLFEEPRHLFSVVSLGFNGKYNRLYTVTAQCDESDLPKYAATLQAVVKSFDSKLAPLMGAPPKR